MSDYSDLRNDDDFKEAFKMFCKEYNFKVSKKTFEETYRGYFSDDYEVALYLIEDKYGQDISETMPNVWYNVNCEGIINDYVRCYDFFYMNGYLFRA